MAKLEQLLKNERVLFFGDSITHNWDKFDHDLNYVNGKDYKGLGSGYVKMLDDVCHFAYVDNVSVSGGCFASCEKRNPLRQAFRHFTYQVDHATCQIKEANYIIIMLGTNDYSEQVPFGKEDSLDKTTFFGGINVGLNQIRKINPKAKIIMLSCINRSFPIEDNRTYSYSLKEYNLAIKVAARMHKAYYIDIYDLFKYLTNQYNDNKDLIYTDDGLHPNHNGYVALTNYLLNCEL